MSAPANAATIAETVDPLAAADPVVCHHCGESAAWASVRFQRSGRYLWVPISTAGDGRVVWWNGEFVALKPGSKVYPGVTAYRLHGQMECAEG
ncbi:MAG: hypothetical protein E4H44_06015 [Candidatus Aminicenantes bacterium]|nr:MAG: hypothetical protein E4H44_06015 [Candidatus Aminicenantes bacterium]HUW00852.1 hypothetical protein [Acidimicrobiales bacterium]